MAMDPFLQYHTVFHKWIRTVGIYLGLDIFHRDYTIDWKNYFLLIFKVLAFSSYFYTMYAYERNMKVKAIGHCGVCFQAIIMPLFVVMGRHELKKLFEFLDNLYKRNQHVVENQEILVRFTQILRKFVKIMMIISFGSGIGFMTGPILTYVTAGEVEELLPSFMPGLDPLNTFVGYIVHYIYHLTVYWISQMLMLFVNGIFLILHLHVILLASIIRNKIKLLNTMNLVKTTTALDVRLHFRNIIMLHNDTITFVNKLAELYTLPIAVLTSICVYDVVLHIFSFFVINWIPPASPPLVLTEFATVGFLCSVGTIFEIMYDKTYEDIITINWYMMPKDCQRDMIVLTNMAMKPHSLTIGGILPLNLDTFVMIAKKMYSLIVVLRQVVS